MMLHGAVEIIQQKREVFSMENKNIDDLINEALAKTKKLNEEVEKQVSQYVENKMLDKNTDRDLLNLNMEKMNAYEFENRDYKEEKERFDEALALIEAQTRKEKREANNNTSHRPIRAAKLAAL